MLQRVKLCACAQQPCRRQRPMNPALPPALKIGIEALLEGVSRKELAEKAAAISQVYRTGGGSAATVSDQAAVLAYISSRLPATYAVTAAVFAEIRDAASDVAPKSLLDVGAGPGTASWAALETWPDIVQVTMMDCNPAFLAVAGKMAASSPWLARTTFFAADIRTAAPVRADLVVASFVLAEIARSDLKEVIARL